LEENLSEGTSIDHMAALRESPDWAVEPSELLV
jgi:hypothetical protein